MAIGRPGRQIVGRAHIGQGQRERAPVRGVRQDFREAHIEALFHRRRVVAAAPQMAVRRAYPAALDQRALHHRHVTLHTAEFAHAAHRHLAAASLPASRAGLDFGRGAARREVEKSVPARALNDVTVHADFVPVRYFLHRMRCIEVAMRAEHLAVPEMAPGAGHAFVLQLGIEIGVVGEDGLPLFRVAKAEHLVFLLPVERNVAVLADLLQLVELPVDQKVGIGPGLAVDARFPFVVDLAVTAATGARSQRVRRH